MNPGEKKKGGGEGEGVWRGRGKKETKYPKYHGTFLENQEPEKPYLFSETGFVPSTKKAALSLSYSLSV